VLANYLAGMPGAEIDFLAADLDRDGAITVRDLLILQRHLAGWSGYETLPYGVKPIIRGLSSTSQRIVELSSPAPVAGGPTINVANVKANVGETVGVTISIENNPGIAEMRLFVNYDESVLKLVRYDDKGLLGNVVHRNWFGSPYTLYWSNSSGGVDISGNGDAITLYFEVLSEGSSDVTVTYGESDILNIASDKIQFGVYNGSVSTQIDNPSEGDVKPEVVLVNVTTTAKDFISITETAKNSRVWVMTFNVTETYSDGTTVVVEQSISLNGNNANLNGSYTFENGSLEGYTLVYDVKGNGSNIKEFSLIK